MVALYQYFGYDIPLNDRFKMIKDAGFDALGVWCDDWLGWTEHREFPRLARDMGLQVFDGHAPFIRDYDIVNSIWLDNQDGETTLEIYMRTIEECGEDGVKNLIIHVDYINAPPPNELGIERFKRMADLAGRKNVCLALENTGKHEYLKYIFDRIASPTVGFCYDAGHRNCDEPEIDLLSLYGDRLIALHLHDNDGSADQHLIPFTAGINWAEQMAAIAATGYTGPTTLECTAGGPGSTVANSPLTAEQWLHEAHVAAVKLEALWR